MIDPQHPFFRPLWVRLLCVALPFGGAAFEMSRGAIVWAVIFGALGAWLFRTLFLPQ